MENKRKYKSYQLSISYNSAGTKFSCKGALGENHQTSPDGEHTTPPR